MGQDERDDVLAVKDKDCLELSLNEYDVRSLLLGKKDVEEGNVFDFNEILADLQAKYRF